MYSEDKMTALPYRRKITEETSAYLKSLRDECDKRRKAFSDYDFSSKEAFEAANKERRKRLITMLGRPLSEYPESIPESYRLLHVADDEQGSIDRLWVECAPGLHSYGLLFTPKGEEPSPFVLALHGGLGTPEIVSSFYNSANYNDMVQRLLCERRMTVYVPQLMLWGPEYNEKDTDAQDHQELDKLLKQCGGSMAALEIFKIRRTVDWLCENRNIDVAHMGVSGLSYGGFYALFTAACDIRFRSVLSSCFFNDRYEYAWGDWTWFDAASKFLDPEVAALVCPRALCINIAESDEIFDINKAQSPLSEIRRLYEKLGIQERFLYAPREGGHQFTKEKSDIDFFLSNL